MRRTGWSGSRCRWYPSGTPAIFLRRWFDYKPTYSLCKGSCLLFVFCSVIISIMKQGKITTNGVVLRAHENATVVFLTQQGYNVELLVPSKLKGAKTPDIHMNRLDWEMKRPAGNSANTIKRAFKAAMKQSSNIIFDLRSSKMTDKVNVAKLEKEFTDMRTVKNLIVITKSCKRLDYSR